MAMSRSTAEQLIKVVVGCGQSLCNLLPALESELSPDEFKKIKREIGRVISTMDDSIAAKVAHQYPDLAPEAAPIAHGL